MTNKHINMLNIINHKGNASLNYSDILLNTHYDDYYLKKQKTNVGKNLKKVEPLGTVSGTQYDGSAKN
jgi:hypothetical protein